jgi:protein-L-isoaspartate O-methyltransferase
MVRKVNWRFLAQELADALEESGDLRSAHWRAAVEDTPRHEFVPYYYRNEGGSPTIWRRLESADGAEWLEPIYTNSTLVTHLDPSTVRRHSEGFTGFPTASSTQPSLMVRMLEALTIEPDHTVLEIGTGTGYNAALLAHGLADARQLTTVDIDPELADAARRRLKSHDHDVTVLACDASTYQWPRTYDRIIVTCALPRIDGRLLAAVAPNGRVIVNVMPPMSGGLAVLTAKTDGSLEGRFHRDGGSFMPARQDSTRYTPPAAPHEQVVETGDTRIPLDAFDDYHFLFMLAAHLPGASLRYGTNEAGQVTRQLVMPDGSWTETTYDGERPLMYHEYGEIWPTADRCWDWFVRQGRPSWERFGLTVTPDAHHFWFDNPDDVLTSF